MDAKAQLEVATTVSPLTVLVRGVLEWTFHGERLAVLFGQHADGQYTRALTAQAISQLFDGDWRKAFSTPRVAGFGAPGRKAPLHSASPRGWWNRRRPPQPRVATGTGRPWPGTTWGMGTSFATGTTRRCCTAAG